MDLINLLPGKLIYSIEVKGVKYFVKNVIKITSLMITIVFLSTDYFYLALPANN